MKNKFLIGTFALNTCNYVTDIITKNLDFIIFDREHGKISLNETYNLLNISKLNKCKSLVRVSNLDKIEIQKVLELNPDGILVPQISSCNDVLKLRNYSFDPPIGNRGLSPYTPGFNYSHQDSEIKKKKINNNLFLGILLEGEKGINDLDVILKDFSKHISLIYFGLYDYASSQGLNPEWSNKKIIKNIKQIVLKCKKKGINVGSIARNSKEIKILKKIGINFICYQNDTGIINQAFSKID